MERVDNSNIHLGHMGHIMKDKVNPYISLFLKVYLLKMLQIIFLFYEKKKLCR